MNISKENDSECRELDDQSWCIEMARRIGAGDARAEGLLVSRLEPGLQLILRSRCRDDSSLAADLSQDTLLIVLRRLRERTLRDPARIAAFAAQTARQLAFDAQRRTLTRQTVVDTGIVEKASLESPPDDSLDRHDVITTVRKFLAELSHGRDREILKRFYLMEQEKADICRQFELESSAFDQVIFRARARLRELLSARGVRSHDLLCLIVPGVPRSWLN